ncbi:hypothetical protein QJS10_CPA08g01865 [Acorus calamus]|uniref:HMA domain-containing protein n=1 Tax=Acorus calamus TaxID=4465 RepID=A0AAV9ECD1_ACOCL|nr:hypothetical protein QJS10_CPA08g01865 [Acorus calamus]
MKKKIVLKVNMCYDKCRTKALKIAASFEGVESVALQGVDKDQLVVIGEGIDAPCLAGTLRKKIGCTEIVTIENVKPPEETKEKEKEKKPCPCCIKNPCLCKVNPCCIKNPCLCKVNPCCNRNPCSCKVNPCCNKNPCYCKVNPCCYKVNPCCNNNLSCNS